MREVKLLTRLLGALEAAHLFVLTGCLSLVLAFTVQELPDTAELFWALGAGLAVLAVNLPCRRLEKKLPRLFVGLGVLGLSLLVCPTGMLRLIYGVCVGLQILTVTVLPRPEGKTVLSVPKLYHAPALLLLYAFSRIFQNDVMQLAAVTLSAVFAVVCLVYLQAGRLLSALCDKSAAAVSDRGIVRLNRRLMLAFCILGAALIVAVPLLWKPRPPQEAVTPVETAEYETEQATQHTVEVQDGEWIDVPSGDPVDLEPMTTSAELLILLLIILVVLLTAAAVVYAVRSLSNDRVRRRVPARQDDLTERLPPQDPERPAVADTAGGSWARRIRRQYQRLIRTKTEKHISLSALTPAELERAAGLQGPARERLHGLYEKARYSGESCEKEDYLAAKTAINTLKKGETA